MKPKLSPREIQALKDDGADIDVPIMPPVPPAPNEELNALRSIVTKLDALIEKPGPEPLTISPPSVTVSPAPVTVQSSSPVRKWVFDVVKLSETKTRITATAAE